MQYAENPETRKIMFAGVEDRLKINVPVLDDILRLRRECAALLGYETWAAYVLEDRMIKSAEAAKHFLSDLRDKLRPVGQNDLQTLLDLKKKEHERLSLPFDGNFYAWDWRYYDRLFIETSLSLDNDAVKEYFPVEAIVKAIMDIYTEMFRVHVEEVSDAVVWHPGIYILLLYLKQSNTAILDVKQFAVWNATGQTPEPEDFLGYLHLDLYPRENKYGHAAVWGLIPGFQLMDGGRNYPVTCMVANLAKPTPDRPGLMTHDDVVTFFHEMGMWNTIRCSSLLC
jgi:Zn-dependent oligopeptidase